MMPHRLNESYPSPIRNPTYSSLVILLISFVLTGCNEDEAGTKTAVIAINTPERIEQPTSILNFDVSLEITDKFDQPSLIFTQGEQINFILSIKNTSSTTQVLNFSSGQQYDFAMVDGDGIDIWRWSHGKLFTASLSSYAIEPGATHIIKVAWNQMISDAGPFIPVGNYTLEAFNIGVNAVPRQNLSII